MVDAVVLAGSPNNGMLKECSSVPYEALIPIGCKLMVEYVLEALCASSRVNQIVLVGPEEKLAKVVQKFSRIRIVPPGETILENVQIGIRSLAGATRILVVTSDIPLISVEAIDDFIIRCHDKTVDVFYPIIARRVVESRFAEAERTYVNLKEGTFTGGNLFLMNPGILPQCLPKGKRLVEARKNPLLMSRLVGLSFLLKFITRRLSLQEAQATVSKLLDIKAAAVISDYPEIGLDVDKPSDLELVTRVLQCA